MKILFCLLFSVFALSESINISFNTKSTLEASSIKIDGAVNFHGTARLKDFKLETEIKGINYVLVTSKIVFQGKVLKYNLDLPSKLDEFSGFMQLPLIASFRDMNGAKFRQFGHFDLLNGDKSFGGLLVSSNSVSNHEPKLKIKVRNVYLEEVSLDMGIFTPSIINPESIQESFILRPNEEKEFEYDLNIPFVSENHFQGLILVNFKKNKKSYAQTTIFNVQTKTPKKLSVFLIGEDNLFKIGVILLLLVLLEPGFVLFRRRLL